MKRVIIIKVDPLKTRRIFAKTRALTFLLVYLSKRYRKRRKSVIYWIFYLGKSYRQNSSSLRHQNPSLNFSIRKACLSISCDFSCGISYISTLLKQSMFKIKSSPFLLLSISCLERCSNRIAEICELRIRRIPSLIVKSFTRALRISFRSVLCITIMSHACPFLCFKHTHKNMLKIYMHASHHLLLQL